MNTNIEKEIQNEIAKVEQAISDTRNTEKITFYEGYLKGLKFIDNIASLAITKTKEAIFGGHTEKEVRDSFEDYIRKDEREKTKEEMKDLIKKTREKVNIFSPATGDRFANDLLTKLK